jgi:probable selenium-dependent hydroxylase accessory protein YqeC
LAAALGLGGSEHVALVGGGGKTTLMLALAQRLGREGGRVVSSTTTKVWHWEALLAPGLSLFPSEGPFTGEIRDLLTKGGHLFVGREVLDSGKVKGISPDFADRIYREPGVDQLILEADGAAGRPVKAPGEQEPVIPASVTLVVAMMGLDALGMPFAPDVVFREDEFRRLTGIDQGVALTPEILARVFKSSGGLFKGSPPGVRLVAFLNKLDLVQADREAWKLARLILHSPGVSIERVVMGSVTKGHYSFIRKDI